MEEELGIFDEEIDLDTPLDGVIESQTTDTDSGVNIDNIFEQDLKAPTEDSIIDVLLKAKGIENSKVTIIDENQNEQELSFYDLSKEEQLEILNTQEAPETDLDDSEVELINHLRTNNMSIDEFLTQYRDAILAETQQPIEPSYDIDAYDDQELFLFDLKNKYDLTDSELQSELEKELGNEELFAKKVTKLRSEYKELEDQYKNNQQLELETEREKQYNEFTDVMVNVATNISDYHGVYLEDDEKNETLSYLLDLDENGTSQFSKDLNNPGKLYEAAWYLRYGSEAFKALESAYEAEIVRLKKTDKPSVVVQNSKKVKNINDLY